MPVSRPKIAIIYDFDGTLAPGNMQEYQFLPEIGIPAEDFWSEVNSLAEDHQGDSILIYMHLMLKKASAAGVPVRRNDFKHHGESMQLFDGVEEWFDRITEYGRCMGTSVDHYLVSSGNEEIIAGSPIRSKFKRIYASKFIFNENDVAEWPALAINYTTKTQYLFRINKGAEDLSDDEKINTFIKKQDRPIPFENMIFIGDGTTDVPCFRMVKDLGGISIAVYKPQTPHARANATKYLEDGRVHCVAPANYADESQLDKIVKARISEIAARESLARLF